MTTVDPIPAIEQLGYTPREAAFVYLVARNSGYFLARQFNWFLRRKMGSLTQAFCDKLSERGHGSVLDYGQGRFVYHLKSKTIYRLLGIENSQNRRVKGDHEIRLRLMILDYLLERLEARVLSTEPEKMEFFLAQPGVTNADLPATTFATAAGQGAATTRYFIERFPILVTGGQVQVAYFDEGAFTVKPFVGYLNRYLALLRTVRAVRIHYVALNASNFGAARKEFEKMFPQVPQPANSKVFPKGPAHLASFFQAQQLWDANSNDFRPEHLAILRDGERLYTAPEHAALKAAWIEGTAAFEQALNKFAVGSNSTATLKTHLLQQNYPVFGFKNSGSWQQKHDSVLDSAQDSI